MGLVEGMLAKARECIMGGEWFWATCTPRDWERLLTLVWEWPGEPDGRVGESECRSSWWEARVRLAKIKRRPGIIA